MIEIWEPIPNYEGLYDVSSIGRIRSYKNNRWGLLKEPKIIRPYMDKVNNRKLATFYRGGIENKVLVHRMVATVFVPNPLNKPEVNHLDGNSLNNYYKNLEWATHAENMKHGFDTGLIDNRGEKCGTSKLTEQDVLEIRHRYKTENVSATELSKEYPVGLSNLCRIIKGELWKHLL